MKMQGYTKKGQKRWHDSKLKDKQLLVGQKVLLFNSRLKLFAGKINSKWSGPFVIMQVFPYGVVELRNERTGQIFKVNGHRVKAYFENDSSTNKQVLCLQLR